MQRADAVADGTFPVPDETVAAPRKFTAPDHVVASPTCNADQGVVHIPDSTVDVNGKSKGHVGHDSAGNLYQREDENKEWSMECDTGDNLRLLTLQSSNNLRLRCTRLDSGDSRYGRRIW